MKENPKLWFYRPLLVISDVLALNLSFFLAYFVRFYTFLPSPRGIPPLKMYLLLLPLVNFVFLGVFKFFELYRDRPTLFFRERFLGLFKATLVACMVLGAFTFLYREFSYSRLVGLFTWGISLIFLTLFRELLRRWRIEFLKKGRGKKKVLLLGGGEGARRVIELTRRYPELGYEPRVVVDPERKEGEYGERIRVEKEKEKVPLLVEEEKVEEIIITRPILSSSEFSELTLRLGTLRVRFTLVPELYGSYLTRRVEEVEGIPFITLKEFPLQGGRAVVKKALDFTFSLLFLSLLSPLFLLIGILIKLTSPGPLIYKQERMGLDGVSFVLYKFRSMGVEAEKEGPVWGKTEDERATPIGRWLRRTGLDELPQLVNVLRGEMSLVGPRPERPVFAKKFREKIPRYLERLKVKAGITGWAQVNGLKGETPLEERIKYDIYYIENWSPGFDLKIMGKTLLLLAREILKI